MCDGEESNPKQMKRKIVSETPDNTSSSSSSGSASACDSGSGSGSGGEKYEVFLSFRGPDTRKAFTDFLFTLLVEKNIRTFRDNEELPVGEEIRPELLKAIEESIIYIPILSRGYASSKSCLLELAHMVGCYKTGGKKIIPVFYDVEPSDVEHQRESYEEAFRQYEKTGDQKTIQHWKDALKVVADLKGLSKKDTDGHEGALTKRVVEEVLLELKNNYTYVLDDVVGMDHHVHEMQRLLDIGSDGVRIVGIHGMGGIGKTTIANFIYNQLRERFQRYCFLRDVRETSEPHNGGLLKLQNQLLSHIGISKDCKIYDETDGIVRIKDAVERNIVLIVLDDVDKKSQFDKLAGNCSWFRSGSRIIVTTRDETVLRDLKVTWKKEDQLQVYQPGFMKDDDSLKVFSKHAFESLSPPKDYESLSKGVVRYAAGLPLVLVVIGSLLRGEEDKKFWEETMKKLKNIPADDVMERLRISYDTLDNGQKQIFLDIACLFVGQDKTDPLYMWEDCGFYPQTGINVLVRRSLIKVECDNGIWMHDQVRDLGRRLVDGDEQNLTDPGERSRLWRHEEAFNVLESDTGTKKVVALSLDSWEYPPRCLEGKDFKELRNLRYLRLGRADFYGDFEHRFSKLRWFECYVGNFKVTNLGLKNLVVLKLSAGDITWSEIKMATNLKVLEIRECPAFKRASDFYSFKSLERLILSGSRSLEEFDPSDGNLTKLRVLDLSNCDCLTRVNCSTFSTLESLDLRYCESLRSLEGLEQLKSLTHMRISGCKKLIEIQGLDRLESLESLYMWAFTSIEKLPDLSSLKNLTTINASRCYKLTEIGGLGELKSLKSLKLGGCVSIEKLPDLSSLKNLTEIDVCGCVKLTEIGGLGELKSLKSLMLCGCKSIEKLPDLSSHKNLTEIDVFGCVKLTEMGGLGELKSLKSLKLDGCKSIEKLPDLSSYKNLTQIDVSGCVKLTEIGGVGELKSLESLELSRCKSIEKLPDLSSHKNLTMIDVSGCVKLTEIVGLGELKSLESLNLWGCESIEKLPDLSSLKQLKEINASCCVKLTEIGGLGELKSLESLKLRGCKSIEKLPDLSSLKNLTTIDVSGCVKLIEIVGLGELKSLESLELCGCKSIEKLPDLSSLKQLTTTNAFLCRKLTEIGGLRELKSLESLELFGCESIEKLSDLSSLKNLTEINVSGCVKLTEIGGLGELKSLESLNLNGCKSIEKLPDLSSHKNSTKIDVSGCVKLTEIVGLGELKSLESLELEACESIEKLPDLSSLENLKFLDISGCSKLLGNPPCVANTCTLTTTREARFLYFQRQREILQNRLVKNQDPYLKILDIHGRLITRHSWMLNYN